MIPIIEVFSRTEYYLQVIVAVSLLVIIIIGGLILYPAYLNHNNREGAEMILKLIYTLFIGVFLAIFVGVGIAAFYPGPKFPDMPAILKYCSPDISQSNTKFAEFKTQMEQFDKAERAFQKASQLYNRNVSTFAVIAAIIIVVTSLTLFRKIFLLADGILLGGVLTLLYSVIRGFNTEDTMFRFIIVSVGLLISLLLGYIKFIRPSQKVID